MIDSLSQSVRFCDAGNWSVWPASRRSSARQTSIQRSHYVEVWLLCACVTPSLYLSVWWFPLQSCIVSHVVRNAVYTMVEKSHWLVTTSRMSRCENCQSHSRHNANDKHLKNLGLTFYFLYKGKDKQLVERYRASILLSV